MKALVTGATGFLGQRLVRRLLDRGARVRCLIRPSGTAAALETLAGLADRNRLEVVRAPLSRVDSYPEVAEGCDVVYHVAAALRGSTAVLFVNNVVATGKLLGLIKGSAIRRFVLVSSLGVYGTARLSPGDVLDEDCPLDPEPHKRDGYTYSKIAQEEAAWQSYRRNGLPLVVVRPGVIYGPGRDYLTNRIGLRVGKWLLKMGDGRPLPYTYVENCAEGVLLAGTTPGVEGQAFNLIDDSLPTSQQLIRHAKRVRSAPRSVFVPGWAIQPLSGLWEWYAEWSGGQVPAVLTRYKSQAQWKRLRYSNRKAKTLLGWQPQVPFRDGLRQTTAALAQLEALQPA
jgi:nucleoside-diphosphate-sugar epimerase